MWRGGNAKINRMWNRILQSITTFFSAGGEAVEQMCWDFCRERRKNLDKHKRKACFTEGCLERGWVKKDSAMSFRLSSVSRSLGRYLLVFCLAQVTQCLKETSQKAFYHSLYRLCLQSKMESSLIHSILEAFVSDFDSWYTDCRFLYSPIDISRPTRFCEPCHHSLCMQNS